MMCWPIGKAERRYAGVTHVDVDRLDAAEVGRIKALLAKKGVFISGLGYYPNPLDEDEVKRGVYVEHIKKVISGASALGVPVVNTFIGRIPARDPEYNFGLFKEVWPSIVEHAESKSVKIAIENCPMYFSKDEWPSGKNLAYSPAHFRRMFELIPSRSFGLNYDPSHLVWQMMDCIKTDQGIQGQDIPRPHQGREAGAARSWTTWAYWPRPSSTTARDCRGWATSTGPPSSRPSWSRAIAGPPASRWRTRITRRTRAT